MSLILVAQVSLLHLHAVFWAFRRDVGGPADACCSVSIPGLQETDEGKLLWQQRLKEEILNLQSEYNTLM